MAKNAVAQWVDARLGDICQPLNERVKPDQFPDDSKFVGLEHVASGAMHLIGWADARTIRSSALNFRKGDVLYSRLRPNLNKVWLAEFDGLCSSEFLVFPSRKGVLNEFLAFRLAASDFVAYAEAQVSGERPRVSFKKLSGFKLALPPESVQLQIAGRLNAALGALRSAVESTVKARARIPDFVASVLESAISGRLSADWRRDHPDVERADSLLRRIGTTRRGEVQFSGPGSAEAVPRPEPDSLLPSSWMWASLGDLGELSRGKSVHRPRNDPRLFGGPYPFVQTGDVRRSGGTVTSFSQTYSEFGLAQSKLWPRGTLCITIAANIAETAVLGIDACFPDSVVGFAQDGGLINIRFIDYIMRCRKQELSDQAPATAQKNINLSILRALLVPLPPVAEQDFIVEHVEKCIASSARLEEKIQAQLERAAEAHHQLLDSSFSPPHGHRLADGHAHEALQKVRADMRSSVARPRHAVDPKQIGRSAMSTFRDRLKREFARLGPNASPQRVFDNAGGKSGDVSDFYEHLKELPKIGRRDLASVEVISKESRRTAKAAKDRSTAKKEQTGRFRLLSLWVEDFKNLKQYRAEFGASHGLDVVMGWNGTGKSNLFEVLAIIFRDLGEWKLKNQWPDTPLKGFVIRYEIDEKIVEVEWDPANTKPTVGLGRISRSKKPSPLLRVTRRDLLLPRFVFGYYSGPTNRLAEIFRPMNVEHYARLRDATTDDPVTLARLLEQRRFFCAETHHAKYVLLAFCFRESPEIAEFLRTRLRIEGFESALFVIRKPRWARPGSTAATFWGAKGVMRKVLDRLRANSLASIVVEQQVNDGYRTIKEEHHYYFVPNLASLHSFAAEYASARAFFLALESIDFSELISDLHVRVRVGSEVEGGASVRFRDMSEGEQQLLMVLGLVRFTRSNQSLVLLDEPDTHLNPHWSVEYLQLLSTVMGRGAGASSEQQSSQILLCTHDPLVIAALVKEQVHLMRREKESGRLNWSDAPVNPKGLGFTGILTSEIFGFRSDLDQATLADLDDKARLMASEGALGAVEERKLAKIDERLSEAGFQMAFSDPYYSAFVRAWAKRHQDVMAGQQDLSPKQRAEIDQIAAEVLKVAIAEVEREEGEQGS